MSNKETDMEEVSGGKYIAEHLIHLRATACCQIKNPLQRPMPV